MHAAAGAVDDAEVLRDVLGDDHDHPMQHQKDGGHLTSVVFQAYVSTMSVSSSLSSASADHGRHGTKTPSATSSLIRATTAFCSTAVDGGENRSKAV